MKKTIILFTSLFLAGCVTTNNNTVATNPAEPKGQAAQQFEIFDTNRSGMVEREEYETWMHAVSIKKLEDAGVSRKDPKSFSSLNEQANAWLQEQKQDVKIIEAIKASFARMDVNQDEKLSLQEYEQGFSK